MDSVSSGSEVSLKRLSELRDAVEALRATLRSAFLERGPRLQMAVYRALVDVLAVYEKRDGRHNTTGETSSSVAEAQYVVLHYMQDILAACILLLDDTDASDSIEFAVSGGSLSAAVDGEIAAAVADAASPSAFYVDKQQRTWCKRVIFYFCWLAPVPLHTILHALYPLVDPTMDSHEGGGRALDQGRPDEAHASRHSVASNLLRHFAPKRKFIFQVLNGLVLQSSVGVRALLRTLLLNDGVTSDMTVEAAQHIVRLLLTNGSMTSAWVVTTRAVEETGAVSGAAVQLQPLELHPRANEEEDTGEVACSVSLRLVTSVDFCKDQIRLLAQQHISLFEEYSSGASDRHDNTRRGIEDRGGKPPAPSFLTRVQRASNRLPEETFEERLHLYLALWLNQALLLPPREENPAAFADSYRRFVATNRFFLTPAFGFLSLRSAAAPRDSSTESMMDAGKVLAVLRRLYTLAHGCTLGASPRRLLLVLEAVMPGLLTLTSCLLSSAGRQQGLLEPCTQLAAEELVAVWHLVFQADTTFDTLGPILVKACSRQRTLAADFVLVPNRVEGAQLRCVAAAAGASAMEEGRENTATWSGLRHLVDPAIGPALEGDSSWSQQKDAASLPPMPATLRQAVLKAVLEEGGQAVLGGGEAARDCDGGDGPPSHPPSLATSPYVSLAESALLSWPADSVFGAAPTLDATLDLLARIAPFSEVCLRCVLELLPRLVGKAVLQAEMEETTTTAAERARWDRPSRAARCLRKVRHLSRVLSALAERMEFEDDEEKLLLAAEEALATAERFLTSIVDEEEAKQNDKGKAGDSAATTLEDQCLSVQRVVAGFVAAASTALDTQSAAMLSLAMMQLSNEVEDIAATLSAAAPFSPDFYALMHATQRVALRCLRESGDACAAGHATRLLIWLPMYRLDSTDTAAWSQEILTELLRNGSGSSSNGGALFVATAVERTMHGVSRPFHAHGQATAAQRARLKVRLLDVVLGLCDYDTDGRTLRNVDDYCKRPTVGLHSLYRVLASLCRVDEPDIVQVAALHVLGPYVTHVYPRVSLSQVCQLCQDVFRLARVEMAKAACTAMLFYVVDFLVSSTTKGPDDIPFSTVKALASAMSTYTTLPPSSPIPSPGEDDEGAAIHAEVIRQNGRRILQLLLSATGIDEVLPSTTGLIEEL